jgi:hypothetical protein
MLKILAGVSVIALVAPTFAQKVYDNNNTVIGPLVSTAGPVVSGPGPGLAITQLNANCQGTPFLSYNPSYDILPLAYFDSQTIWAIDVSQVGIYSMKSAKLNQTCHTYPSASTVQNVAPAVSTTVRFSGPISVR